MNIEKLFHFIEDPITHIDADGIKYIALKPFCTSLDIDYQNAFETIKRNEGMFKDAMKLFKVVAADGKLREMACIPEYVIYGWILNLNCKSEKLKEFQLACYDVLYKHFKGGVFFN